MILAERVRAVREWRGFSMAELAAEAKVSKGYLHAIEADQAPRPGAMVVYRLARELGVRMEYLLGVDEL